MAKCIRLKKTGKIERVSDDEAHQMVSSGKAMYVPKKMWKEEVRDADTV